MYYARRAALAMLAAAALAGGAASLVEGGEPITDIWRAAVEGDLGAIRKCLREGADMNEALEAPGVPGDGAAPLHWTAFPGRRDIAEMLLEAGADATATDNHGNTPLGAASDKETEALLQAHAATGKAEPLPPAPTGYVGSYFRNGEIYVNEYGTPEGEPLTTGHQDFKPSWSKTGDMLVFFRRLKDDPVVTNWITQVCIINVDGTGFHRLTNGTHTDFNPTWTRDGTNTPIWNRKNPETGGFIVMAGKVGGRPGEEIALTGTGYHTWAYTCLMDGRILVQRIHPTEGRGYYLMTPNPGDEPTFERIECKLAERGILDRISLSPSETRVCFEYQTGFVYKDPGRTLYIADFDAEKHSITNAKPFANEEGAQRWFAYPRWTKDEAAIVYHASPSLYMYFLEDDSTRRVSTTDGADYRYPHCEGAPK
ncbi:MAG: ankyrin repeat domain-containing protein [Armatimonadota bacterium]